MTPHSLSKTQTWLPAVLVFVIVSLACSLSPSPATPTPTAAPPLPSTPPVPYIRLGHAPHDAIADGDTIRNCQGQPMEWPIISGATDYDIHIATTSDFAAPVIIDQIVDASVGGYQQYDVEQHRASYTFGTLYYYRVRGRNNSSTTAFSSSRSFRWPSPPSLTPEPTSPSDAETVYSGWMFTWNYADPAGDPFEGDCFHIQIATDAAFAAVAHDTYFFAPTLDYGLPASLASGTYYWRLAACNNAGPVIPTCGPFSEARSFDLIAGGVVRGAVYADLNADGDAEDADEGLLDGVTVSLSGCGPDDSQVTAADGIFLFTGLPAGTCLVSVAKPGWEYVGAFPAGLPYPVPAASDPSLPTAFSIFMDTTESAEPPASPALPPEPVPLSPTPSGVLRFEYVIETVGPNPSDPGQWLAVFVITAYGGDGRYRYFHDSIPLDGPRFSVVYQACRSKPGSIEVRDGTGQSVTVKYFLEAPYCNKTPTPSR